MSASERRFVESTAAMERRGTEGGLRSRVIVLGRLATAGLAACGLLCACIEEAQTSPQASVLAPASVEAAAQAPASDEEPPERGAPEVESRELVEFRERIEGYHALPTVDPLWDDEASLARARERLLGEGRAEDARLLDEACEAVREHLANGGTTGSLFEFSIEPGTAPADLEEAKRALIRWYAAETTPWLRELEAWEGHSRVDFRSLADRARKGEPLDSLGRPYLLLPYPIVHAFRARWLDGRADEALRSIQLLLDSSLMYERAPIELLQSMETLYLDAAAECFALLLPSLPPEVDVAALEQLANELRPRESRRTALYEQLTLARAALDELQGIARASGEPEAREAAARSAAERDAQRLADRYRQGLERWNAPWNERREAFEALDDWRRDATGADARIALLVPAFGSIDEGVNFAEANLLLLRLGLASRRLDAAALRARLIHSTDPCSGRPLPFTVADDGTIRCWSVGTNARNDGGHGPPEGDDLLLVIPAPH